MDVKLTNENNVGFRLCSSYKLKKMAARQARMAQLVAYRLADPAI